MTDSIYDQLNASGTVAKQRFVETFSGDALDTDRWAKTDITGTGSIGINDSVDGGGFVKSGGGSADASQIAFNGVGQYAHNASVCIGVTKTATTTSFSRFGFTSNGTTATNLNVADFENNSSDTYTSLRSGDAGSTSVINSTTAQHVNWTTIKLELTASNIILYEEGVSTATKTTNLPVVSLEPIVRIESASVATVKEISVRYMECYNT